jgi:O-antigen ligase
MKPSPTEARVQPEPPVASERSQTLLPVLFGGLFGAFLGLALLKFGNPPIMEGVDLGRLPESGPAEPAAGGTPNLWAWFWDRFWHTLLTFPWPMTWAYALLGALTVFGLFTLRRPPGVRLWLGALPLAWLLWQCLAATQSVDPRLTRLTLAHFAACVGCFYLGYLCLSRLQTPFFVSLGLLGGFLIVLAIGLDQHFGGLEQYRQFTLRQIYLYPETNKVTPAFLKKLSSTRIYATLFYPNALAGALLLLLPASLDWIGRFRDWLITAKRTEVLATLGIILAASAWLYVSGSGVGLGWFLLLSLATVLRAPRWLLMGLLGLAGVACLYWSGSKGGWLLLLGLGLIALLRLRFSRRLKLAMVVGILTIGLAGFFVKYSGFFQKGATSVSARFDYWRAALQTARERPMFGTGPGTFAIPYERLKRPEAEFSRIVHNDYLEQASDSGWPGFLSYTLFVVAALVVGYKRSGDWPLFLVWLGVLGWALQGLLEFGLYLPALAWPAFAFLGWLLARKDVASKSVISNR